MTPAGIGMISYPWKLPVTPGFTMPPLYGVELLHAPGLMGVANGSPAGAGVTNVPSLNCSTTTRAPFWLNTEKNLVKWSVAQSFPHEPESASFVVVNGP